MSSFSKLPLKVIGVAFAASTGCFWMQRQKQGDMLSRIQGTSFEILGSCLPVQQVRAFEDENFVKRIIKPIGVSVRKEKTLITDIEAVDRCGETMLMYFAESGDFERVESLLRAGADINSKGNTNVKGNRGDTALIKAVLKGHIKIVELLINRKADIEVRDKYDRTALMIATEEGDQKIVELLLKAGTCVFVKDKYGVTALDIAQCLGYRKITELLTRRETKENMVKEQK